MDILSEVLRTIRVNGTVNLVADLSSPWGISVPRADSGATFYLVSGGSMFIEVGESANQLKLTAGDFVMLPGGDAHKLRSDPHCQVRPIAEITGSETVGTWFAEDLDPAPLLRYGGGGSPTELFGGSFRFDTDAALSILRTMGPLLHVKSDTEGSPDFGSLLGLSCREARHPLPGSRYVMSELIKLLFIQMLRSALSQRRGQTACASSPFALMFQPGMEPVAEAIHLHPERDWTVAELAQRAHMSRTSFSTRFAEITGLSPLAYLTRWRMIKASELLRNRNLGIATVAAAVGYGSESAFSIAFKRQMGIAPGRYRSDAAALVGART